MPRTTTKRKTSDAEIEQQSVKRQKKYSEREPPWEEQQKLGGDFEEVGEGNWPVEAILDERPVDQKPRPGPKKLEYLLSWVPHPKTGEEWEPTWTAAEFVGEGLKKEWKKKKARERTSLNRLTSKTASAVIPSARAKRNKRVVPDSSSDATQDHKNLSDDAPSTPPLTSRASSVSGPEISETQEPYSSTRRVGIVIPPVTDIDKADFESIRPSQFSSQNLTTSSTSPASQIVISSSPSVQRASSASARVSRLARTSLQSSKITSAGNHRLISSGNETVASQPQSQSLRGKRSRVSQSLPPSAQKSSSPLAVNTPLSLNNSSNTNRTRSSGVSLSGGLPQKSRRLASPFGTIHTARNSERVPAVSKRIRPESGLIDSSKIKAGSALGNIRVLQRPPKPIRKSLTIEGFVPLPSSMASVNADSQIPATDASSFSIGGEKTAVEGDELAVDVEEHDSQSLHLNPTFGHATLDIQESIEEEPQSSKTPQFIESKASSSQESLIQERWIPSVNGTRISTCPVLGPHEHFFSLPAEGKVKSLYSETIKAKRKAILRFLQRQDSPGISENSDRKRRERNEMLELLQRLNNATTHFDLGLEDMQTQYEPDSQQAVAWANYAGSKFVALGSIIESLRDRLRDRQCSFAVVAQSGQLQVLLAQYIRMQHVNLRQADEQDQSSPTEQSGLSIDLLETHSAKVVQLPTKPLFIIAFDATFQSSSAQIKAMREQFGDSLPIIYLLVDNSSEHVERCVPESIDPSLRLKIVVRTTYLAAPHLGGDISLLTDESDGPLEALRHDVLSLQRAVKKSPVRKIAYIAEELVSAALSDDSAEKWGLSMPELQLEKMGDTPRKGSRAVSKTPQPTSSRAQTPLSRAATPVARKRLLEQDGDNGAKRQRLTPVQDIAHEHISNSHSSVSAFAQEELMAARAELDRSKQAQLMAEQKQNAAEAKAEDWQTSLAELQGRYEQRRKKTHRLEKENKQLNATITNLQTKLEKSQTEKQALKDRNVELTQERDDARKALIDTGGDAAALEQARQEARDAQAKQTVSDKSLENMKGDVEFMRERYQDASQKALDHAAEISKLESEIKNLKLAAEDQRRSLKSLNYNVSIQRHIAAAEKAALEVKNRDAVIKRLQEENTLLKSKRGVQTRGSSAQPNASPGTRSRQASPAPGLLAPPSGSRTSVLRHER